MSRILGPHVDGGPAGFSEASESKFEFVGCRYEGVGYLESMRRNQVLFLFVIGVVVAGCGGGSGPADETSTTDPGGDIATTQADSGNDDGNGGAADASARLVQVCEPGIAAASDASGIEFAPDDDSTACQSFDPDTAATVQISVQPRLDTEGNECDAIASGSVPESYGDTGTIIDTAVGSAFSGEQSDIAQVIGCDDEYRYLAQASTFDDSPAVALQVYEAMVGA